MRFPGHWWVLAAVLLVGCRGTGALRGPGERVFVGNATFSDAELNDVVSREFLASETTEISRTAVDDAAFALELFYRKRGFASVLVEYELVDEAAGRVRFDIDEGPRTRIGLLKIEGNASYGNDELSALVPGLKPEEPWVESTVSYGAGSVRDFYYGSGFLRAEVEGRTEADEDGTLATVTLEVFEGPRYRVVDVVLDGAPPELADLVALERRYEDVTYTPRLAYEIRAALIDTLGQDGYPDAEASFETLIDDGTGDVELTYALTPGEEVHIRGILFEGNERTTTNFLVQRLGIDPGSRWSANLVREGFRSLWSTGLFRSVELQLVQDSGPERDLRVLVEEAPSLEVYVEPGWGSYEGPRFRFGVDERNLFGTARRGFFEASVSPLAQVAELGLDDPWFLGSTLRAESSIFGNRREEPSFTTEELGFRFGLRRAWTPTISSAIGYEFRATRLPEVEVADDVPPEALDDFDIATIQLSLVHDTRDNLLIPRSGGRARVQLEWASTALGSELEFGAIDVDLSRTATVGSTVFAMSARAGVTAPYGDTEVLPLAERRFNGGENTVRAFREDELGPLDAQGEPLGGEAYTVLSAELRRPLAGNLEYALFVDSGNVVPQAGDFFEFEGFRTGVGLGLRYLLPIGPLRFDFAVNPDADNGEDEYVLHFAVGLPY